jgi:hypothetical protein
MMHTDPNRRPLWPAVLVYITLALLSTWPLASRLATYLPVGTDTLSHYWNGWATLQALRSGHSPYFTPYLFYPTGVSTVYKNYAWLHIAAWIALRPLVGGIVAYNLAFLAGLVLCGCAAFALVYEFTGDRRASLVAGVIYQCWPYRMTQPSHPNLISTAAIPLFVLFLRRTLRRGRWQDGLLTGLCVALVGYTRWQLLIPAAIVGGIVGLWNLPRRPSRGLILALGLAGLLAGAALAPPALLLAREMRSTPASLTKEDEESIMQTDVLAYVTPPSSHVALGAWTKPAYQRFYAGRGSRFVHSPYVGWVVLLLALAGIAKGRLRDSLPWMVLSMLMILLALGPDLRVNGRVYPNVPMFYNLAIRLPGIQLMRVPERFNMFLALPAAVLSGYGLVYLLSTDAAARAGLAGRSGNKRWIGAAASVLIAAAVWLEYLVVPYPLQDARVSAFYAQLAAEPGDGAILNVPVDPYASKPYMYAQTVHQRPIVQGRVSRYPKGVFAYLESQPWIHEMRRYPDIPPQQVDVSRQLDALAEDGIRYLIVHKNLIGTAHWERWARYLALKPRFEDADIAVLSTRPVAGQDFELALELVPGLGIVRAIPSSTCIRPGGTLQVDVAWGTSAPPGKDLNVALALVSRDGAARLAADHPISPDWPSRKWPAHALVWGHYAVQAPADLAAGLYDVTLGLSDLETGLALGEPAVLDQVSVQSSPCAFSVPDGAMQTNARFGDAMRLLGYRLEPQEERVELVLLWRPERRMETEYKVFVHIYDPGTGIPVAQDDAMPLHWTYPTSYWRLGEVIADAISISMEDVPPGEYGVAVGVYDPASGERLLVWDSLDRLQPDGRLVFSGETVRVD